MKEDTRRLLAAPYLLDESVIRRFDQKFTGFARAGWDPSFKGFGKGISDGSPAKAGLGVPGYSRVEYAMQAAAWTVYDTYQGGFSWSRIGDMQAGVGPLNRTADPIAASDGPCRIPGPEAARAVKKAAAAFGSFKTGIADVNPLWVYSSRVSGEPLDIPQGMTRAVVMLIEMDDGAIRTSPALGAAVATGNGYSRMCFAAACMAEFIRNLGWSAAACGNDTALSVPLAVDAGLGEFGRNGLLITPEIGQRVRICKVFTDLPLEPDRPASFGARRFCMTCMKCAASCPAGAISRDREPTWKSPWGSPSNCDGSYKWYVNADECYSFWTANTADCSNCIRICPYTKKPGAIHALPRFFIRRLPFLNRLWLGLDSAFGYDRMADPGGFMRG